MDINLLGFLLALSLLSAISLVDSTSPPLFLTSLIKNNKTEAARKLSEVDRSLFQNISSHSGFLTVDAKYNSNTFFWYFPVAGKPVNETPWIIWLQGGPGASSLAGLFDEIGPFEYKHEGGLKLRNHSWTKEYSVVFVDNPVGAGYSFTEDDAGYAQNMTMYSANLFEALQQLLLVFPELRKPPLFIAGESYAGRYVPTLATRILEQNQTLDVNLQGLIMGNPVLNHEDIANYTEVFHQWGLIDAQGVLAVKTQQDQYIKAIKSSNATLAYQLREKLLDKLQEITKKKQLFNLLVDNYSFTDFEEFLSSEEVKDAIHVGDRAFTFDNSSVKDHLITVFISNMHPVVEKLLDHYRVLIYCGLLDLTAPCVQNSEARRNWHWNRSAEFFREPRVSWFSDETIAGYVKSGGGFTEALVIGAGHLVPIEKPAEALKLISNFINKEDPLSTPSVTPLPSENANASTINNSGLATTESTSSVNVTNGTKYDTNVATIGNNTTSAITDGTNTTNGTISGVANNTSTDNTTISAVIDNSTQVPANINGTTNQSNKTDETTAQISSTNKTTTAYTNQSDSKSEGLKQNASESGTSTGTVVSILLNVLLVVALIGGALYYYRQRRRNADYFYSNVETNSEDLFLT